MTAFKETAVSCSYCILHLIDIFNYGCVFMIISRHCLFEPSRGRTNNVVSEQV